MFDPKLQYEEFREGLDTAYRRVMTSGYFLLGPETSSFESEFAAALGAKYAVALSSGTTALFCALKAYGIGAGDEVITVANTCAPTASAICMTGARPRFVDLDKDSLMMDPALVGNSINKRTKAVIPVHLWGNAVCMPDLMSVAEQNGIPVIEDCAQAMGTRIGSKHVGNFGSIGCFSFYPTKNLGCFGDGGAIITNSERLADSIKMLRMYGYRGQQVSERLGYNARIDELQSAFLRVRLSQFTAWQSRRWQNAGHYDDALDTITRPAIADDVTHAFHQYVILTDNRKRLQDYLSDQGIDTAIHYAEPLHRMPAFKAFAEKLPITEWAADRILSLPVHQGLGKTQVANVCDSILRFEAS